MSTPDDLVYKRESILLPEKKSETRCAPKDMIPKGIVSLDWVHVFGHDPQPTKCEAVVVIIPGLTGSSGSGYVQRLAHHLLTRSKLSLRVACYNPRGRGNNPLLTPFLYSAGYTEDLRRVLRRVRDVYPSEIPLYGVGYSLGSNVLAKCIGEDGNMSPLAGACCLACPIDCLSMSNSLANTISGKLMDRVLVRFVRKVAHESAHVLSGSTTVDMDAILKAPTMASFDRHAVAPLMNAASASEYYREASAGLYLSNIRRPTLFIHADDDPVVSAEKIRLDDFESNEHLYSIITAGGGHSMDWPEGFLADRSWSAEVVKEFIETVFNHRRIQSP